MPATYNDVRIGFEYECIVPAGWGYNGTRDKLRDNLNLIFNDRNRDYRHWTIVGDGSVNPTAGRGGEAIEIVSPIMPLDDGLRTMSRLLEWCNANGVYTNSSCGFHVGVSVNGHMRNFDKFTVLVAMDHSSVHRKWGRVNCTYAQNLITGTKNQLKNRAITWETNWPEHVPLLERVKQCIPVTKYSGANLSKMQLENPYVEFRAMGGCIDNRVPEVIDTVMHYADVMIKATDPNWSNTPTGARKTTAFLEECATIVQTEREVRRQQVEQQERAQRELLERRRREMYTMFNHRYASLQLIRGNLPIAPIEVPERPQNRRQRRHNPHHGAQRHVPMPQPAVNQEAAVPEPRAPLQADYDPTGLQDMIMRDIRERWGTIGD